MTCILCHAAGAISIRAPLSRDFFHCSQCDMVFLNPGHRLSPDEEKQRYQEHNNDLNDPRYQEFVRPLVEALLARIPEKSQGLDFGAGTGPIMAQMLEARSYSMERYDPFFWPNKDLLNRRYDFICASEVVEHLCDPQREFTLLKGMLKPGGTLGLMTLMRNDQTDLPNWYYLRDPTHICAYSEKTFHWIAAKFGFDLPEFPSQRVIILKRSPDVTDGEDTSK